MAYNSLKSYWIWRRKKEAEEKAWRELGVDEKHHCRNSRLRQNCI